MKVSDDVELKALDELKHSIKVYLSLVGMPTPDLGSISIKLIDCLDDALTGKDPTEELNRLAVIVVHTIVPALVERFNCLEQPCRNASVAHMNLEAATMRPSTPELPLSFKYTCLRAIADALRELKSMTGIEYPPITDLEGNPL